MNYADNFLGTLLLHDVVTLTSEGILIFDSADLVFCVCIARHIPLSASHASPSQAYANQNLNEFCSPDLQLRLIVDLNQNRVTEAEAERENVEHGNGE